ncbi:MAG: MerR family transcriptional regulator [Patescibacteria group bacterium]
MPYTVKQLADLAGISVRTLHFYDQAGILKPDRTKANGYRYYEEKELLKLQQILFFRELDFSIQEIKKIISAPDFDMRTALKGQRKLIELKKNRLERLVETIDRTIQKINKEKNMADQDLYGNFSKEEMDRYTEEAREKWGNTDAYKQSQERVKKMGKAGLNQVLKESGLLTQEIAECMKKGEDPKGETVQKLIARHYDGLRAFYEPNFQIYRGLAGAYIGDDRFKANYEKVAEGLAQYMHDGMIHYCDTHESEK